MTGKVVDWRARRERNLQGAGSQAPAMPDAADATPLSGMARNDAADARARRKRLIEKMPASSQNMIERLEPVRAVYVESGRDALLSRMLTTFHEVILTEEGDGTAPGGVFFITGEPGAGKTWAVRAMLRRHPVLQPETFSFGTTAPFVSISLKGAATLNQLGQKIMDAAGYPIKKSSQSEIWGELCDWLKLRNIHLVHIDETQHLMRKTEKDAERRGLADALKGAMNHVPWPISFVLSGLPYVTELARLDEQFERRSMMIKLPDVDMDPVADGEENDRHLVENIIRKLSEAADLQCDAVIASDVPERLAHSVRYRYGRICQAVFASIHNAMTQNHRSLKREHFARASLGVSHVRGYDDFNVFLTDDWRRLEPGSFILPESQV